MRNPFPLAAALILVATCALRAAEKPRPAPATQNQAHSLQKTPAKTKKVWTDEDVAGLRSRGLISIVGQEPGQEPASGQMAPAATEPSFPVYDSRLDDPAWYGAVAADLQVQLDQAEADLQQQQSALADAKDRVTQPGVALNEPSLGVTPDGALAILQSRVQEIQSRLDGLADLARQHDIPPGDLRS